MIEAPEPLYDCLHQVVTSSFASSNMALAWDTCRTFGLFVSFLAIFLGCFHLTEAGGKTLVLLDNANTKETHSIFFNSLKGRLC